MIRLRGGKICECDEVVLQFVLSWTVRSNFSTYRVDTFIVVYLAFIEFLMWLALSTFLSNLSQVISISGDIFREICGHSEVRQLNALVVSRRLQWRIACFVLKFSGIFQRSISFHIFSLSNSDYKKRICAEILPLIR